MITKYYNIIEKGWQKIRNIMNYNNCNIGMRLNPMNIYISGLLVDCRLYN